jgi:hypothetical protein
MPIIQLLKHYFKSTYIIGAFLDAQNLHGLLPPVGLGGNEKWEMKSEKYIGLIGESRDPETSSGWRLGWKFKTCAFVYSGKGLKPSPKPPAYCVSFYPLPPGEGVAANGNWLRRVRENVGFKTCALSCAKGIPSGQLCGKPAQRMGVVAADGGGTKTDSLTWKGAPTKN